MNGSGSTVSAWMQIGGLPSDGPLQGDVQTQVCIVGAGMAGLSTAYMLACEGQAVVVLDDGGVCDGETARTTAHLSNALDDRYYELERIRGADAARLAAQSHTAAIDRVESIIRQEHADCDFRRVDGYLFNRQAQTGDELDKELAAARRAGLTGVEKVDAIPGWAYGAGPALRFPNQGQFHPLKYLRALCERIRARGGKIYTGTHARKFEVDQLAKVGTSGGQSVTAETLVVATNSPVNDWTKIHTKQAPYRTYAIGLRIPRGGVPAMLLWETGSPYNYIRTQPLDDGHDLLIVGGEDHKTGQAADFQQRFDRLEAWTRPRFPMAEQVLFRWSGQVMETLDGLAYIGRNPGDRPNCFIATGDSGMGMTHGTIAGILLTDLIVGRPNAWRDLYEPSRKPIGGAMDFLRENLNVAAQFADYVTAAEVQSVDDVAPGTGALVRQGIKKVAVYRDPGGQVHRMSASCSHLGCMVHWNDLEKTWDCPCHGSRFDATGHVVAGPAYGDLTPVAAKEEAKV